MATTAEALAIAIEHHQAGRLAEAEQIYRQILRVEPNHAGALHLLGVMAHQAGQHEIAVQYIARAIELKGDVAAFHGNLGGVYLALRRPAQAAACYRRALELKPDYAEVHCNLGNMLKEQGTLDEAVACYRRALEVKPHYAEAYNNLGAALQDQGNLDAAIASYRRALKLQPHFAEVYYNLGNALKDGRKPDEAVACFRRAVELKPDFAVAHYNLGNALKELRRPDDAVACYRRAVAVKPDYPEAHNNLGNALKDQGRLDEAAASYRRALELKPDFTKAHSNLVYALLFCADCDGATLDEEHRRWNQRHATPLARFIQPHLNDPSPARRLRVGYVSPDFEGHPVGRFLLPLLEAHDHGSFKIFCYASVRAPGAWTDRCRARADVWRDVLGMSDEQVADAVRQDRIDILVDLTMHMAESRLLVFARKPAPVQVTYLAYCGTTGLGTMDYRLTDPYLDPPASAAAVAPGDQRLYCEQSVYLPQTYWCYQPVIGALPVTALPALAAGHVTFASLNNFCKVTVPTLAAWGRLLQAVPGSRLLLHAHPGSHRDRVRHFLAQQGISAERLVFIDFQLAAGYYGVYQQADVALDPFPYGGGTTTCDALWMGVPVVSLAGQTAVGRGGLSILSNVGLPQLVAHDVEQYLRIAVDLAADLPRLAELRATLRGRMQESPLMDAPRFARGIEAAYRQMWRRWCEGQEQR